MSMFESADLFYKDTVLQWTYFFPHVTELGRGGCIFLLQDLALTE